MTSRVSSPSDPHSETFAESESRPNINGALEQVVYNTNKKTPLCKIYSLRLYSP
jgi:hypothetical protein